PNHERAARDSGPPPLWDPPSGPSRLPDPPSGPVQAAGSSNGAPPPGAGIPANALPIASVRPRISSAARPQSPPSGASVRPTPPTAFLQPPPARGGTPTRPLTAVAHPRTKPPTPPVVQGRAPSPPLSVPTRSLSPTLPPQVKSIGSGPVFTGDLEEFCLPDLLEFLRNSHRSGLLMCTTTAGVGTIQLSRGMIISADSPNALDLREH